MNKPIKIAIIDDEQLIAEGVKSLLSAEKSITVCLIAYNGNDFIAMLGELAPDDLPDIALIDIQMQPINGFELVEILRQTYPQLKVIILSSHYKSSVLGYMIKLGISAFIPKNSNREDVVEIVQKVHEYGVYFSPKDHQMLLSYMNNIPKKKTLFNIQNELTDREKDVIKLICEQHTNDEIAKRLFLSPRTIEGHRQRIIDKIGAKNTVGIVIYAIVNEIYTPFR